MVRSVRGSCSVVWLPSESVVVEVVGLGDPTLRTVTFGSNSRVHAEPWAPVAPPVVAVGWRLLTKIATWEPFWMLPATRSGSVRFTEMATMPLGIGRLVEAACTVLPNWLLMICWPEKIGTEAILPFREVRDV